MQYVEVVVNVKIKPGEDVFTYKIPPEFLPYIQKGILVEVPFRSGAKKAVVIGIKSRAETSIKKLKSIKKIISSRPILDDIRLELANWMTKYYWSSLGETVFMMIPPIPKRFIKKDLFFISPKITSISSNIFRQSPIYTIHDCLNNRLKIYSQLLQRTFAKQKQCLVLVSHIERAEYFLRWARKNINGAKAAIYHHRLNKTDRYRIWKEIAEGKYHLVIGTRSGIFSPLSNIGLIIIDNCNDRFSYKEEQSPYYDSLNVAKKISQLIGAQLVLGDLIPSVENYFYLEKGMYRPLLLPREQEFKLQNGSQLLRKKIQLINMNNYPASQIISYELEEGIRKVLAKGQRVLLFLNRKGKSKIWFCRDCGEILRENEKHILSECNQCGGTNFKEVGIDIPKAAATAKALFPQAKIAVLQKENQISVVPAKEGIYSDHDILLITSTVFYHHLGLKNIGLTAVISMDYELNLPDFRASEDVFLLLTKLSGLSSELLIQTNSPENPVITSLTTVNHQKFYEGELKARRQFNYPPYTQLIRLTFHRNHQEKITNWLRLLTKDGEEFSFMSDQIQAVIKLKNTSSFTLFKKIFTNKIKLDWSKIKIEVDPI